MLRYDSFDKSDLCCSFTKGKGKLGRSINFQFRLPHFTKVLVCRCRLRLLRVKAVFSPRMLHEAVFVSTVFSQYNASYAHVLELFP